MAPLSRLRGGIAAASRPRGAHPDFLDPLFPYTPSKKWSPGPPGRTSRRPASAPILLAFALLPGVANAALAARQQVEPAPLPAAPVPSDFGRSFALGSPESQGLDTGKLIELTRWIQDAPVPIFSLLISRRGTLVYELYTSKLGREEAHYQMSVTKSFDSALIGIAIGRRLLRGPDARVTDTLPRRLFAGDADFARLSQLTIRQVLGMAALDAPLPPHDPSPAALRRQKDFWTATDRVAFALRQPLLPLPPDRSTAHRYQYNDVTPMLATALIQYAAEESAFDFAQKHLFEPLGFRNAEWMHQDESGVDNGGYGLRLRPIDMQKFGVLYLRRGSWEGRQLLPKSWVDRSFEPWNRSKPELERPDYGWYWWTFDAGPGWTTHSANGWKGQRIDIFPEQGLVVTMTACIEDGSENEVFRKIIDGYVRPAARKAKGALPRAPRKSTAQLADLLAAVQQSARMPAAIEARMLPSVARKEERRPFTVGVR